MNAVQNLREGTVTVSINDFNEEINKAKEAYRQEMAALEDYKRRLHNLQEAYEKKTAGIPVFNVLNRYRDTYSPDREVSWFCPLDEALKKHDQYIRSEYILIAQEEAIKALPSIFGWRPFSKRILKQIKLRFRD